MSSIVPECSRDAWESVKRPGLTSIFVRMQALHLPLEQGLQLLVAMSPMHPSLPLPAALGVPLLLLMLLLLLGPLALLVLLVLLVLVALSVVLSTL